MKRECMVYEYLTLNVAEKVTQAYVKAVTLLMDRMHVSFLIHLRSTYMSISREDTLVGPKCQKVMLIETRATTLLCLRTFSLSGRLIQCGHKS